MFDETAEPRDQPGRALLPANEDLEIPCLARRSRGQTVGILGLEQIDQGGEARDLSLEALILERLLHAIFATGPRAFRGRERERRESLDSSQLQSPQLGLLSGAPIV